MKGRQEHLVQPEPSYATEPQAQGSNARLATSPAPLPTTHMVAEPYPSLIPPQDIQDRLVQTNLASTGPHLSLLFHYFPPKYFVIFPLPRVHTDTIRSGSEDGSDMEDTGSDMEDTGSVKEYPLSDMEGIESDSGDSTSDIESDEPIPESSLVHHSSATLTPTGDVVMPEILANPKFLVTKMNRVIANDKNVLAVEVKFAEAMSESKWKAATGQLHEYMDTASALAPGSDGRRKIAGLLVCGPWVQISRLGPETGGRVVTDKERHYINSPPIWNLLLDISKENRD